jgi:hypothetical protein
LCDNRRLHRIIARSCDGAFRIVGDATSDHARASVADGNFIPAREISRFREPCSQGRLSRSREQMGELLEPRTFGEVIDAIAAVSPAFFSALGETVVVEMAACPTKHNLLRGAEFCQP